MTDISHKDFNPSSFLVENIHLLPKGCALDVAMGKGRNAIYLAQKGFKVEGVDISSENVDLANKAAKKAGVNLLSHVVDLERDNYIAKEVYDVIICFKYLQRSLIPHIKEGLRVGGIVIYETYTVDQTQFGKPKNPDYLLKYNELLDMFHDFRCLRYREGIIEDRKAIAGIVAEKTDRISN